MPVDDRRRDRVRSASLRDVAREQDRRGAGGGGGPIVSDDVGAVLCL